MRVIKGELLVLIAQRNRDSGSAGPVGLASFLETWWATATASRLSTSTKAEAFVQRLVGWFKEQKWVVAGRGGLRTGSWLQYSLLNAGLSLHPLWPAPCAPVCLCIGPRTALPTCLPTPSLGCSLMDRLLEYEREMAAQGLAVPQPASAQQETGGQGQSLCFLDVVVLPLLDMDHDGVVTRSELHQLQVRAGRPRLWSLQATADYHAECFDDHACADPCERLRQEGGHERPKLLAGTAGCSVHGGCSAAEEN